MGSIEPIMKKFFIMDTSENYYRLDKNGQLVVADGKEDAVFFTYEEADKKIGKGKRAHFYKIVPTGMHPAASTVQDQPADNTSAQEDNKFDAPELADLSRVDWLVYLQNFSYIVNNIREYKEQLCAAESKQDQAILDLLHFIEIYDLDGAQTQDILCQVKTAREHRRDIKNELYRIGQFTSSIGTTNNVCLVNNAVRSIQHYEASKYKPRVLTGLFNDAPEEIHRKVGCYHNMAKRYNRIQDDCPDTDTQWEFEEGADMERTNTIYDGIKMDWDFFVQRQADFFRYAHQHVRNLEIDLEEVDNQIESTLIACEDARYNVAQGYTVFKQLIELRNKRKEIVLELQKVTAITDRFDCDVMRDIYDAIESEYATIDFPEDVTSSAQDDQESITKAV